ncbi:MAG: hypothetical protein ACOCQD_00210 [archaeon]
MLIDVRERIRYENAREFLEEEVTNNELCEIFDTYCIESILEEYQCHVDIVEKVVDTWSRYLFVKMDGEFITVNEIKLPQKILHECEKEKIGLPISCPCKCDGGEYRYVYGWLDTEKNTRFCMLQCLVCKEIVVVAEDYLKMMDEMRDDKNE